MTSEAKNGWQGFAGANAAYLTELYDRYLADPDAVDAETRAFFERWGPPPAPTVAAVELAGVIAPPRHAALVMAAIALSTAIRMYGYRAARLDPLGSKPYGDAALMPETYGIREEDLAGLPAFIVGGPVAEVAPDALAAIRLLRRIYEGTTGYEFEHVSNAEERNWLRAAVESARFEPPQDPIDERRLLERLTQVEAFERFLQTTFPTQTRFSIEGLDVLVPLLDELIGAAAESGTQQVMLGMAHRGRLNVLAHVLGMSYERIIAEFLESYPRSNIPASGHVDVGWTGDVKYHLGARRAYRGGRQVGMLVSLIPNPSHLEFVDPVVEGMTRAASVRRGRRGPAAADEAQALAVLIHGEAAFMGEGIVAETLNLSRLPGFRAGGTVHIIGNNQLGFTTPVESGRSTLFASDLAKGFEMPVIHVNADDPDATIVAVRLAHAFVEQFHKDVVVDVIGYRRRGHNEGDEPSFTQPSMYRVIAQHPTVRELWAKELEHRGLIRADEAQALLREMTGRLQGIYRSLPKIGATESDVDPAGLEAGGTHGGLGHAGPAPEIQTAVLAATLAMLNEQLLALPPGFKLHQKLAPLSARRRAAFAPTADGGEGGRVDWAHAEVLAYASILAEGTPIRLTGQDVTRGTFSQRHLVLHDAATEKTYTPLQEIPAAQASFDVWDSPLSEQAILGFEFGYSVQAPKALVLWEAQYGDFVDAAQVIVDEFIASARSKWELHTGLALLLPHGYEGQGPDHSSARVERFLQLAAEDNLRIANCTTAAQYFHILRRQARLLTLDPRPLVLFTPKSLLRHVLAMSPVEDLSQGRFRPVIDDPQAAAVPAAVRRLILCTGKVYVDLAAGRRALEEKTRTANEVAIVRVEELYPFPAAEIEQVVARYSHLEEVLWVQEEPRNMGAWTYVAPRIRDLLGERLPLCYVGRTRRASPAEGSHEWQVREQARLVEAALLRSRAFVRGQQ